LLEYRNRLSAQGDKLPGARAVQPVIARRVCIAGIPFSGKTG